MLKYKGAYVKNFLILFFSIFLFNFNISFASNFKQIAIKSDLFSSGKIFFNVVNFSFCQDPKKVGIKKFIVVDDKGKETETFGIIMKLASGIQEEFNLRITDGKFLMYPFYEKNVIKK